METELLEEAELDVPSLIRGRYVALAGRPASMNVKEFIELLEANGGKYSTQVARGVSVIVVGQRDWPLTAEGKLPGGLQLARQLIRREHARTRVISEEQFLSAFGLEAYRENLQRLYSLSTLSELLQVPRDRIRAWVAAALIRPAKVEYGVWYFQFRQVASAKTLWRLLQSGISMRRLQASLEQLRRWMPEAGEPLQQLSILHGKRHLLARLEDGELIEPDGQLHLDFGHEAGSLKIMPGPRTAMDWAMQGLEQEREGLHAEAADSYRQALLLGGPDARICFDLANVLSEQGKKAAAVERYLQAVEIDPSFGYAWNNLGLVLAQLGRLEDACGAFRKALAADPMDLRAHYNLADTLDELGRAAEAAEHWRAYLQYCSDTPQVAYAQARLAVS